MNVIPQNFFQELKKNIFIFESFKVKNKVNNTPYSCNSYKCKS